MGANRAPGQNQQHLKVQGLRGPVCCVWRKPPLKTSHTDAPRSEKTPSAETQQKTHTNCGGRLILEEHTQQCSTDVMQHVRRTLQASRLALMELHSFGHMPAQNKSSIPAKRPKFPKPPRRTGAFPQPKGPRNKRAACLHRENERSRWVLGRRVSEKSNASPGGPRLEPVGQGRQAEGVVHVRQAIRLRRKNGNCAPSVACFF